MFSFAKDIGIDLGTANAGFHEGKGDRYAPEPSVVKKPWDAARTPCLRLGHKG